MGMLETVAILFFTDSEKKSGVAEDTVANIIETEGLFSDGYAAQWRRNPTTKKWQAKVSREVVAA